MIVWGAMAMMAAGPAIAVFPVAGNGGAQRLVIPALAGRNAAPARVTPVLDALFVANSARRGARIVQRFAGLTLSAEGRRPRKALGSGRTGRGRAREFTAAFALDWAPMDGGGHWQVMAGTDRGVPVYGGLGRVRGGTNLTVTEARFVDAAGWSVGLGWRSSSTGGGSGRDGFALARAVAAPPSSAGVFLQGSAQVGAATVRVQGGSYRLTGPMIGDGVSDRRATVGIRWPLS